MEINRLTITTESRILGDEYVRFGGEYIETCFHKGKQGALCLAIGPVICRKGEADDTIGFSNNATHARQHMHYHSLSKSKVDRHMEPFIIDIDANDEKDFFLSAHEGEEFIMVLKGELEISYGKSNYRLKEGDTIYYDSIVPHHVHTAEGQAAQILAVVYTPV